MMFMPEDKSTAALASDLFVNLIGVAAGAILGYYLTHRFERAKEAKARAERAESISTLLIEGLSATLISIWSMQAKVERTGEIPDVRYNDRFPDVHTLLAAQECYNGDPARYERLVALMIVLPSIHAMVDRARRAELVATAMDSVSGLTPGRTEEFQALLRSLADAAALCREHVLFLDPERQGELDHQRSLLFAGIPRPPSASVFDGTRPPRGGERT